MNPKRLALALLALASTHCGANTAQLPRADQGPDRRENGSLAYANASSVALGNDAAIALLESLLLAMRDEDAAGTARCFANEPIQLGHTNAPTATPMRQDLAVQRVLGARHASGLSRSTPLDALIDRASVITTSAGRRFPVLPAGLREGDIVVTFQVRPLAERALLAIALRGEGLLVIRIATDGAQIVAL